MNILKILKDILSPKKCHSCNSEGHFLCINCYKKLENYKSFCYVCKNKSNKFEIHQECKKGIFFDNLIVLTHYRNHIIKKLIQDFKFYSKKDIAEDLGYYLSQALLKTNLGLINNDNVLLTSVSSTFVRRLKRGYNQSELLAKEISKITNIKYQTSLVKKIYDTGQQALLSKEKRLINLQKSFKINKKYVDKIDKKIIIIVDDVVSTGTTINTISKILKENGVQKIIGLVIASD